MAGARLDGDNGWRNDAQPRALTARQDQIMALVADGCIVKEIARELGISRWTVDHHLENVVCRLHARNRYQAVAMWARAGMTP